MTDTIETETVSLSDIESKETKSEDLITFYSGEVLPVLTKSQQQTRKYHCNFKEKHKDKINEKVICPICYGSYSYFNKSSHCKTKRHLRALDYSK